MIKLILGLGNPGNKYQDTRHNVGYDFVQGLTSIYFCDFKAETKLHAEVARLDTENGAHRLAKSLTYMNESGRCVQALMRFYKIKPEELLVAHDDLDLPASHLRLKFGGGHGGHNGLRSIFQHIGPNFWRARIGIGHPGHKDQVSPYVLSRPSPQDREAILNSINQALSFADHLLLGDFEHVMQHLHTSKG